MASNATTADPFTECNVILLPFLVFFCICLMIIYVMCKYKICAKDAKDMSEKEKTWIKILINFEMKYYLDVNAKRTFPINPQNTSCLAMTMRRWRSKINIYYHLRRLGPLWMFNELLRAVGGTVVRSMTTTTEMSVTFQFTPYTNFKLASSTQQIGPQ